MNKINGTIESDSFKLKGLFITVSAEATGQYVDNGIGHYEVHGRTGYDSQWMFEPDELTITSITINDVDFEDMEEFKEKYPRVFEWIDDKVFSESEFEVDLKGEEIPPHWH